MNLNSAQFFIILHNIRSAQNVGAIFRTADAVGVEKIYLTGYTPAPLDRFGRTDSKIAKTALGAEKSIPWESCKSVGALIKRLKKNGVHIALPCCRFHGKNNAEKTIYNFRQNWEGASFTNSCANCSGSGSSTCCTKNSIR